MLNLSSWLSGYYPERKFEISAFVGPSLMLRSQKIYPAVNAGLIGSWNITPSWSLYLEPKLGGFLIEMVLMMLWQPIKWFLLRHL